MHKDLIGLITGMMPKLSKGQKQIARYIVEHYDKAAFMTAARLGQAVGVSESNRENDGERKSSCRRKDLFFQWLRADWKQLFRLVASPLPSP